MGRIANTELLLLTASYLERIEGRKRFQKTVFLLQEYFGFEFSYRFASYLYGPYCSQLQNDIDILTRMDYLIARKFGYLFTYEVTTYGKETAHQIEKKYGEERADELRKRVENLNELDTDELVKWSKQIMHKKVKNDIFAQ